MGQQEESQFTMSRAKIASTIGYYGAFIALGITVAALGPTLPGLAAHARAGLGAISILFTARSLGYLVGSFQGGRLYDRLPGHPVLATVLLLMAAMLASIPFVPELWVLVGIVLILGVAEGMVEVGSNTLLLWIHAANAAPFVNALHFFFGVGAFLAPIVVAQSLSLIDEPVYSYWVFALLALPVAGWLIRLPSPQKVISESAPSAQREPVWIALVAVFFFLYAGVEHSFGGWIYTYATTMNPGTETTAAYLASAFWGAITVGRLLAILLAVRIQLHRMVWASLAGCLLCTGVFLLFPGSVLAIWLASAGLGLGLASIVPTTLAYVGRQMGITGRATGWFFVGLGSGAMTIPWLIGQLFEQVGPRAMVVTILVEVLLALGLFFLMTRYAARPLRSQA